MGLALRFVPSEMNGPDSPLSPQVPGVMRILVLEVKVTIVHKKLDFHVYPSKL